LRLGVTSNVIDSLSPALTSVSLMEVFTVKCIVSLRNGGDADCADVPGPQMTQMAKTAIDFRIRMLGRL